MPQNNLNSIHYIVNHIIIHYVVLGTARPIRGGPKDRLLFAWFGTIGERIHVNEDILYRASQVKT